MKSPPFCFINLFLLMAYLFLSGFQLVRAQGTSPLPPTGTVLANSYVDAGRFLGYGTYQVTLSTFDRKLTIGYISSSFMVPFNPSKFVSISAFDTEITVEKEGSINFLLHNGGNITLDYSRFTIKRVFKPLCVFSQVFKTIPPNSYETFKIEYSYRQTCNKGRKYALYFEPKSPPVSVYVISDYYQSNQEPALSAFSPINFTSGGIVRKYVLPIPEHISYFNSFNFIYLKCDSPDNCPIRFEVFTEKSECQVPNEDGSGAVIIVLLICVIFFCVSCYVIALVLIVMILRKRRENQATSNSTFHISSETPVTMTVPLVPAAQLGSQKVEQPASELPFPLVDSQYGNPNYGRPGAIQPHNTGPSVSSNFK